MPPSFLPRPRRPLAARFFAPRFLGALGLAATIAAATVATAAPPRTAPKHAAACRHGACAPHCPVRPQVFGYYPTTWRRWPGEGGTPTTAPADAAPGAPRSVVPLPDEESPRSDDAATDARTGRPTGPGLAAGPDRVDPAAAAALRGSAADQAAFSAALVRRLLTEADPAARAAIVETASLFATPDALAICVGAAQDPDPRVRSTACDVWAKRGGEQAVDLLCSSAGADPDPAVRRRAVIALGGTGDTGDTAAIAALVAALDDADPTVQQAAVAALRRVSGEEHGDDPAGWRRWAARRGTDGSRWSWAWPWGRLF